MGGENMSITAFLKTSGFAGSAIRWSFSDGKEDRRFVMDWFKGDKCQFKNNVCPFYGQCSVFLSKSSAK
jgi:hypothetical protein